MFVATSGGLHAPNKGLLRDQCLSILLNTVAQSDHYNQTVAPTRILLFATRRDEAKTRLLLQVRMGTLILAITSLFLYSIGTTFQALVFRRHLTYQRGLNLLIGGLALISHASLTWQLVWSRSHDDLNLGVFEASVLISALIVAMLLILDWLKPARNLFLAAYPIAALSIITALVFHCPPHYVEQMGAGMLAHIALSVTAYSLFTLAGVQALLLQLQNRKLKRQYNSLLIRNLPPLQSMESLLFQLVWGGLIMLTLAIISGSLFVDNLFAQHLVHKTVFSLLSWLVFAGLLVGRYAWGWRGATASRWTLAGFILLMLGYFGSKIALEMIFHKPY